MAIESGETSTDMEVSIPSPSPNAKDRGFPSTPSTISTDVSSTTGDAPQESPKDAESRADEASAQEPSTATPKEASASDFCDEIETNDAKNASFDEDGNEIPFDEVNQEGAQLDGDANEEEEEVAAKEVEEAALEEGEEKGKPEESSPGTEPEIEGKKAISVQVTFDLPTDDDQSDDDKKEESTPASALITPRSGGVSFAQAFSTSPLPASVSPPLTSTSKSPRSTSNASTSTRSYEDTNADTPTSHSALSASKNKKASDLIAKYQEKVAHEALPGDSVPIRSPTYSGSNLLSGVEQKSARKSFVEHNSLPDMNSVRAKFEKSSRKSGGKFEFGESFRQKQRHDQLSQKQNKEEAKVSIRGFNEKVLNNGKTASAEIDTSHLPKTFTFDLNKCTPLFPNDGVCRVDYINADFRAKVFVVHKTRGMLLLQDKHATTYTSKSSGKIKKKRKNTVPGGKIKEEEFLAAAKESGSPQVQLQTAAREAAARHVFEITGLDIRQQAERLKPAVLCMTPAMNSARGYEYLRNENEEKLYYFLQVDEDDFTKMQEEQGEDEARPRLTRPSEDAGEDPAPAKLKRPSEDPGDEPLSLKLSSDYSGYEFVQDPVRANKVLKKDGNDAAVALSMIMSAAAQEISGPTSSGDSPQNNGPDAKATEFASKSMLDDDLDDDDIHINDGRVRTIGIDENETENPTEEESEGPSREDTEDDAGENAEGVLSEEAAEKLTEDAEGALSEEAAEKPMGDAEGALSEDATDQPAKIDDGNTFYHDKAKIDIKTSADTIDEPVGVSCCCGFW